MDVRSDSVVMSSLAEEARPRVRFALPSLPHWENEAATRLRPLLPCEDTARDATGDAESNPRQTRNATALILNFLASRTARNRFMLLTNYPASGILC